MGKLLVAASAAASVFAAGSASASVIVVGKALASSCSSAAFEGAKDRQSLDTCSRALAEEGLTGRNRAGTHVNRGVIQIRRGEFRSAMRDLDEAAALHPTMGEAFVNRAVVHIQEGRYAQAVADIEHGLSVGVSQPERAYFNRGMAREWLEDTQGAYRDYRQAAQLNPKWRAPREQLARFTVVNNPH